MRRLLLLILLLGLGSETAAADPLAQWLLDQLYGPAQGGGPHHWQMPDDGAGPDAMRGVDLEVRPVLLHPYHQGNGERLLLVAALVPVQRDCHSCQVLIAAAVFAHTDHAWAIKQNARDLATAGSFGQPPAIRFHRLGPVAFGFAVTDTFGAQGGTTRRLSIYRVSDSAIDRVLETDEIDQTSPFAIGPDMATPDHLVCHQTDRHFHPLPSRHQGLFDLMMRVETGSRTLPDTAKANPCDIPLRQSPDYSRTDVAVRFTGKAYCQVRAIPGLSDILPLCP